MADVPRGDHNSRRLWWRIGGAVVVVVVLLGVTAWFVTRPDDSDAEQAHTGGGDSLDSELAEQFSLTSGESRCVIDRSEGRLSHDAIRALAAEPTPDDTDQAVLDEILTGCSLSPVARGESAGPTEGQPDSYGDDPELDALWDQCSEEGTAICDELFNAAPEASEYEAFADSCGGRGDPQVACAPDALAGTDPANSGADQPPGGGDDELERLRGECAAGDAQACLALEFQAPEGSELAEFGGSCGGRPDDDRCSATG